MKKLGSIFLNGTEKENKPDNRWVLPECSIGIEIEAEGVYNSRCYDPRDDGVPYSINNLWKCVSDGSLRNNGAEFVSDVLWGVDLTNGLTTINEYLQAKETKIKYSNRTSVHIHMDIRDLTLDQLKNLIQYYLIFEIPLMKFSGNRLNSEYCIPYYQSLVGLQALGNIMNDQSELYQMLENFDPATQNVKSLSKLTSRYFVKYMSMNVVPLASLGSIEFRSHVGTHNFNTIENWINVLMCLKKAAIEDKYEQMPYLNFSNIGPLVLMQDVFGGHFNSIYYNDIENDLWLGCRAAQEAFNALILSRVHNNLIERLNLLGQLKDMFKQYKAKEKGIEFNQLNVAWPRIRFHNNETAVAYEEEEPPPEYYEEPEEDPDEGEY